LILFVIMNSSLKEIQNLSSQLKQLNESYYSEESDALKQRLARLDTAKLESVIQTFFKEHIDKADLTHPEQLLDRLSLVMPSPNIEQIRSQTHNECPQAEYYLAMTQNTGVDWREHISALCDGVIAIIDNVIRAFGIAAFFEATDSDLHADFKSQKIMMLLSLFSMLMTMLMPIVGLPAASIAIGGFFLTLFVLSFLWPCIKPMPQHLPANAENWTQQIKQGGCVGQGRKQAFDAIANILKMNRHPILVGPSRVGKSLTAKGFAQAIARGDYPELKGKVVFRINTADLLDQKPSFLGGGNNILQQISLAMGRHRKNIILVLDEIHMACKNNEKISDMLKTFLEEGGEFAHVIGITTEEEYVHVAANTAFSLRFDRVNIENTNREETLRILADAALKSVQRPLLEEGILSYIYDKTCDIEAPQPTTALKLLKKCINQTSKTQKSSTEEEGMRVDNEIHSLKAQGSAYRKMPQEVQEKLTALKEQRVRLEASQRAEQRALGQLFQSKELLEKIKTHYYRSVIQTASGQLTNPQATHLHLTHLLIEVLETAIKEKSQALGIKGVVDRSLVDQFTQIPTSSLREEVTASFGAVAD
jgi:ATP-dependent Clp protease ATP-binding subunit ClpA